MASSFAGTPCETCPAGAFLPPRARGLCASYACPIGTVDHDEDAATACQTCGPNTFQPLRANTFCFAATDCVPGQFVVREANITM